MMHRLVGSSGPARRVAYALRCAGVARHITMASAARASVSGAGDKADAEVLFGSTGAVKTIELHRPRALNALNLNMVRSIMKQLDVWEEEAKAGAAHTAVVTKGTGEKAFCAGGDVVSLAKAGQNGGSLTADFFKEEYILDHRLATMAFPHIAFMDGITMGGGVGLSVHGSYRVATERTVFAMPETAIGFFPDVGGAHFLPRLDGELGTFLALSGHRLKGADVLYAGIATHFVSSAKLEELEKALGSQSDLSDAAIQDVLASFSDDPGTTSLFDNRTVIDRCFAQSSVADILAALDAEGSDFAAKVAKTMRRMSPTSLVVTLEQLRRGAALDLAGCLEMEYRISQAFMKGKDFYEGIRAVLVDKDNKPVWPPETDNVDTYFADLGDNELKLGAGAAAPLADTGLPSQAAIEAAVAKLTAEGTAVTAEAVVGQLGVKARPGTTTKIEALLAL